MADAALTGKRLDAAEAALELRGGAAQRHLRLDFELARQVGDGEQQIAHLLLKRRGTHFSSHLGFELGDLLGDLREDGARIRPVETDAGGAARDLGGAQQGGEGEGDAIQLTGGHAVLAPWPRPPPPLSRPPRPPPPPPPNHPPLPHTTPPT